MFAILRTGGKQYRVAAGDKIVVEKLAGNAGDTVTFDDLLFASDAGEVKPTDGLSVAAEILVQGRGDKVIVFKKRRRHNYRRRNGHRQSLTVLKILSVGDAKKAAPKKEAAKPLLSNVEGAEPQVETVAAPEAQAAPAKVAAPKKTAAPKAAAPAKAEAAPKKAAAPKKPKAAE